MNNMIRKIFLFFLILLLVWFGIQLNLLIHQVPILQFLSGAPLSHRGPIPGGCPGHRAARAGALGQVGATHQCSGGWWTALLFKNGIQVTALIPSSGSSSTSTEIIINFAELQPLDPVRTPCLFVLSALREWNQAREEGDQCHLFLITITMWSSLSSSLWAHPHRPHRSKNDPQGPWFSLPWLQLPPLWAKMCRWKFAQVLKIWKVCKIDRWVAWALHATIIRNND